MIFFRPSEEELAELLHEVDEDGSGEIEFDEFKELLAGQADDGDDEEEEGGDGGD